MKILFFVNSLGGGGAERVCVNLANEYVARGVDVYFITLFKNKAYQDDKKNFNILCLNLQKEDSKICIIKNILDNRKRINTFILENSIIEPYVLITAHLPLSHICASISLVGSECLYVQHTSLWGSKFKFYLFYKNFYKEKINVCVSNGLAKEFIDVIGYTNKNIRVIFNPILIDDIKMHAKENFHYPKPYILCVGRLSQEKRFDRAIRIFFEGKYYIKYQLVILGEGEKRKELESWAKRFELEKFIYFAGWQKNVYMWMHHAELLLHTSEYEALPMVLIEALASKTRIVASNCKFGADEILTGELEKFIANKDDISDYIKKINAALREFPLNCDYEILKKCDSSFVAQQYLNVYKQYFGNDIHKY